MIRSRMGFGLWLVTVLVGCGYGSEKIPKGHEIAAETSPDGYSRAFVWFPKLSGLLGATVSQPYQVWIQYLQGNREQRLIFKADRTEGVKLTWKGPRELEICYGPARISEFRNFFDYAEQGWQPRQLYQVEIVLRRVGKLAEC
jgi:hypothetical protein